MSLNVREREKQCDDDVYYYIGERLKLEGETERLSFSERETMDFTVFTVFSEAISHFIQREKGGLFRKYREATQTGWAK